MVELNDDYDPTTKAESFRKYLAEGTMSADRIFAILAIIAIDTQADTVDKPELDELKELARAYVDYVGSPALLHIGKGSD